MAKHSALTKQRMSRAQNHRHLTLKQKRFVQQYAKHGNGTKAAREAGYSDSSDNVLGFQAWENLKKPKIVAALEQEEARVAEEMDFSTARVRRRLDALSHGAEAEKQYAVSVRAEELLGKDAGMFVDRSLSITANLSGDHLQALLEVARQRQAQPLDLGRGIKAADEDRRTFIMENAREPDK